MAAQSQCGYRSSAVRSSNVYLPCAGYLVAARNRCSTTAAVSPATRITFRRLVSPAAIVTDERATFKSLARNSMHDSLARPSIGGEVRDSLSASPSSPETAFFLARG